MTEENPDSEQSLPGTGESKRDVMLPVAHVVFSHFKGEPPGPTVLHRPLKDENNQEVIGEDGKVEMKTTLCLYLELDHGDQHQKSEERRLLSTLLMANVDGLHPNAHAGDYFGIAIDGKYAGKIVDFLEESMAGEANGAPVVNYTNGSTRADLGDEPNHFPGFLRKISVPRDESKIPVEEKTDGEVPGTEVTAVELFLPDHYWRAKQ